MSKLVNLVIEIDTEAGTIRFDPDGSREWIRRLFQPETNTYDTELGEYVEDIDSEIAAVQLLSEIGIKVSTDDFLHWRER